MTKNDNNGVKPGEKTPGQIKREQNLVKFTPMTSRQAQEASVRARNIRKQVRAEVLRKVVENVDFSDELMKAIKKGDTKRIEMLQTAMRLIGLHYDQSEDAVNKLQIDATTDSKVDNTVHFVLGERPAPKA
jgi:UPF0288 family protein (methanogenesis marker protein 3)